MEKNTKKDKYMYIHIYITESLCCAPETNTTLQINYNSVKCSFKKKVNLWLFHLWTSTCDSVSPVTLKWALRVVWLEHRKSSITSVGDVVVTMVVVVLEPCNSKLAVVLLLTVSPTSPPPPQFLFYLDKSPDCVSSHSHMVSPALHESSSEVAGC